MMKVTRTELYQKGDKSQGRGKRTCTYNGPTRLSPAEIAEKRRLGLYYKCQEKWYRVHKCGNMELQVLTVIDGCEIEICDEDWTEMLEDRVAVVKLSLHTFLGYSSPTTTKLWGKIG